MIVTRTTTGSWVWYLATAIDGFKKIALGNNVFASKTHPNVVVTESRRVLKAKRVLKVLKNKGKGTFKIKKRGG